MTVLVSSKINGVVSKTPLKVLLDSGSTSNFIYPTCLPKACRPTAMANAIEVALLKGNATVNQTVDLEDVVLSEFSHTCHIDKIPCYVKERRLELDCGSACFLDTDRLPSFRIRFTLGWPSVTCNQIRFAGHGNECFLNVYHGPVATTEPTDSRSGT